MKLNIKRLTNVKPAAYIFMYTCTNIETTSPYYEYALSIFDNKYIIDHSTRLRSSIFDAFQLEHFHKNAEMISRELDHTPFYSSPKALDNSGLERYFTNNTIKQIAAIKISNFSDKGEYSIEHISDITILNSFQEIKDYIDDEK